MVISENLEEKVIIIAESDTKLLLEIRAHLKEAGFSNIKIAENGKKIYDILKPFYDHPEQVGLIIVNQDLPNCEVIEMCQTLSFSEGRSLIPFIVLQSTSKNNATDRKKFHPNSLIHYSALPINYSEFMLVIDFQLRINQERFLRYKQEELLINELAERKVVDAKLKYLVVHDELTSLLNRHNFERKLKLALNRNNRLHQKGALLFVDIDLFSLINELESFDVGDRLLVEVVAIIRKQTNKEDLFARIGSDEFCIFIDNKNIKEVNKFAETIRKEIYESRFFIGDACYSTSVSIGISPLKSKKAICHPSEMISRARQACKVAKENGRNMVYVYNEKHTKAKERDRDIYWVPLIRKALVERNFFLVFQPVVELKTGNISHYEALIRMRGRDNETIAPIDFIPVAERIGLIHRIDHWVVESAIDFLADLSPNLADVSLSINLSSAAFQDNSLLPVIKEKLDLTWVDPKRITFEITETVALDKIDQTRELISKIRALGCKFALDDFGAGFCSFNYLKSFPVEYVKIDGQFIRNLIHDDTDQILVRSMVEIASKLGKKTIAEFVESPLAVVKLQEIGIDYGQGYIFGEPRVNLLSANHISIADLLKGTPQPEPLQIPKINLWDK